MKYVPEMNDEPRGLEGGIDLEEDLEEDFDEEEMMSQIPSLAEMIRQLGEGEDTVLAHITPDEAAQLAQQSQGGSINPITSLPQFGPGSRRAPVFNRMFDIPTATGGHRPSHPDYDRSYRPYRHTGSSHFNYNNTRVPTHYSHSSGSGRSSAPRNRFSAPRNRFSASSSSGSSHVSAPVYTPPPPPPKTPSYIPVRSSSSKDPILNRMFNIPTRSSGSGFSRSSEPILNRMFNVPTSTGGHRPSRSIRADHSGSSAPSKRPILNRMFGIPTSSPKHSPSYGRPFAEYAGASSDFSPEKYHLTLPVKDKPSMYETGLLDFSKPAFGYGGDSKREMPTWNYSDPSSRPAKGWDYGVSGYIDPVNPKQRGYQVDLRSDDPLGDQAKFDKYYGNDRNTYFDGRPSRRKSPEAREEPSFLDRLIERTGDYFSNPENLVKLGAGAISAFKKPKKKTPTDYAKEEKEYKKALQLTPEEQEAEEKYLLAQAQMRRRIERDKFLPSERIADLKPLYARYNTGLERGERGNWIEYYDNPEFRGKPVRR